MSNNIIQLNQELIHNELKDLVKNSVEETLNALLDHEAENLVNAQKYERSANRQGYRAGHYNRKLQTTAGNVDLKVPKLKGLSFETAIIERYRRRNLCGRSTHRNVSGRSIRPSCGGYHRSPVGHKGIAGHNQQLK